MRACPVLACTASMQRLYALIEEVSQHSRARKYTGPPNWWNYMIHRRGMKKSKPRRKRMPNNLEAKVVFLLDRSEEEIQAIDGHPAVRSASEKIRKALEAATGWRMRKQGGIPKKQFKLAAAFEDALGQLKEAYISARLEYLSKRPAQ